MVGDRHTVSITEASTQVGVSRRTIYNWMAEGKVQYVRTAGGAVRIFSETLWRRADAPLRRPPRAAIMTEPQ